MINRKALWSAVAAIMMLGAACSDSGSTDRVSASSQPDPAGQVDVDEPSVSVPEANAGEEPKPSPTVSCDDVDSAAVKAEVGNDIDLDEVVDENETGWQFGRGCNIGLAIAETSSDVIIAGFGIGKADTTPENMADRCEVECEPYGSNAVSGTFFGPMVICWDDPSGRPLRLVRLTIKGDQLDTDKIASICERLLLLHPNR